MVLPPEIPSGITGGSLFALAFDPKPFVSVMEKLQRFSSNLWGEDFYALDEYLRACNAYEKPEDAKLQFLDRLGSSIY